MSRLRLPPTSMLLCAAWLVIGCADEAMTADDAVVRPDLGGPDAAGPPARDAEARTDADNAADQDAPAPDARPTFDAGPAPDARLPPDAAPADAMAPDAATASASKRSTTHEAPPLAMRNACGVLSYGQYANRGANEPAVHRLPDFSYAGYRGGGVALPDLPTVAELEGPSGGDDRARIQAALDALADRAPGPDGFRGALRLGRGEWRVDGTLYLRGRGMVLRGDGQGRQGTRIVATRAEQHDLIVLQGEGRGLGEVAGTRQRITDARVPVGARQFTVASAVGFAVGDVIGVERTPNQRWIDTLDMGQWGWTPASYAIAHERRVVAVDGDRLTVEAPLVDAIEDRFGGGAAFVADVSGRISDVGVEDLRLISTFAGPEDGPTAGRRCGSARCATASCAASPSSTSATRRSASKTQAASTRSKRSPCAPRSRRSPAAGGTRSTSHRAPATSSSGATAPTPATTSSAARAP
ncbi:MAG: hypothetical protein KC620_18305, partial [Myxococcales bacterium]|nr:hypothetical protein [Myxococcales bacterium]